jgi:hypothetical protein
MLEALLPVRFSSTVLPTASGAGDFSGFAGKYANGTSSLEIAMSNGKLTAKTGGDAMPMEAVGADCFSGPLTVCFANGYAHMGGRAFRKQ